MSAPMSAVEMRCANAFVGGYRHGISGDRPTKDDLAGYHSLAAADYILRCLGEMPDGPDPEDPTTQVAGRDLPNELSAVVAMISNLAVTVAMSNEAIHAAVAPGRPWAEQDVALGHLAEQRTEALKVYARAVRMGQTMIRDAVAAEAAKAIAELNANDQESGT